MLVPCWRNGGYAAPPLSISANMRHWTYVGSMLTQHWFNVSCLLGLVTTCRVWAMSNKLNEWGLRPPLCTYRLNWTGRISWRWWDERHDTALQTQDSKFEPGRSEAEQATSRSRRLPTILDIYEWAGKKHFVSLKLEGQSGVRTRDLRLSKQAALTNVPGAPPISLWTMTSHILTGVLNPVSCTMGTQPDPLHPRGHHRPPPRVLSLVQTWLFDPTAFPW